MAAARLIQPLLLSSARAIVVMSRWPLPRPPVSISTREAPYAPTLTDPSTVRA